MQKLQGGAPIESTSASDPSVRPAKPFDPLRITPEPRDARFRKHVSIQGRCQHRIAATRRTQSRNQMLERQKRRDLDPSAKCINRGYYQCASKGCCLVTQSLSILPIQNLVIKKTQDRVGHGSFCGFRVGPYIFQDRADIFWGRGQTDFLQRIQNGPVPRMLA